MTTSSGTRPDHQDLLPVSTQDFEAALGARYQRALQVIDEALESENFKHKIWAVDRILKSIKSCTSAAQKNKRLAEPTKKAAEPAKKTVVYSRQLFQPSPVY